MLSRYASLALVVSLSAVSACGGASVAQTTAANAPPVPRAQASALPVATLTAPVVLLDPNPESGALATPLAGMQAALEIDARGLRGKLTGLNKVQGELGVSFSRYGESAKHGRSRVWTSGSEALVVGGMEVGTGRFDAEEGHDELFWDGVPAFDPRAVFGEFVGTRTAFRERLKEASLKTPYGFLLATNPMQTAGYPKLQAVSDALLLTVHPSDAYTSTLRITLATTLTKQLLLSAAKPGAALSPTEEAQLSGLARAYARDVLRQFGSIDGDDVARDVSGTLAALATQNAAVSDAEGEQGLGGSKLRATLLTAGLQADAYGFALSLQGGFAAAYERLHADSRAQGLLVFLPMLKAAALPQTGLADKLRKAAAANPCYVAATQKVRYASFGLDVDASRSEMKVEGLRAGGPAAQAGLKEGERMTQVKGAYDEGNARVLGVVLPGGREVLVRALWKEQSTVSALRKKDANPNRCRSLP
jgi:hypothetical protein